MHALKCHKKTRYRFSYLVNELKSTQCRRVRRVLLQTVNSLTEHAASTDERIRIRNEFTGRLYRPTFARSFRRWLLATTAIRCRTTVERPSNQSRIVVVTTALGPLISIKILEYITLPGPVYNHLVADKQQGRPQYNIVGCLRIKE